MTNMSIEPAPPLHVEFYHSILCPRCHFVARTLHRLQEESMPELQIHRIEITFNLQRARQAGIRMVPALKINDQILSGLFLSRAEIKRFVSAQLSGNQPSRRTGHRQPDAPCSEHG